MPFQVKIRVFSRPLKTQFEEFKIKKRRLLGVVEIKEGFKNLAQKEKRIHLPLVDHPFEVHACCR